MVSDAGLGATPTAPLSTRAMAFLRRSAVLIGFIALCIFFSLFAPSFATPGNALNIVSQGVILTFCAMAMTLVITAGGIDLSIGVSFDFAAMVAVTLLVAKVPWPVALAAGLAVGTSVGVFNALMIVKLGISPFLATLGMLFIGQSVQKIVTTGGAPIYVAVMDPAYRFLGSGKLFGFLPFSVVLAAIVVVVMFVLIERMTHGRRWRALGAQPEAARIAGIAVDLYGSSAYIVAAFVSAMAGIVLSASLSSYVPISGGSYLMDAIGATFIGSAVDPEGRPNVRGTLLGVLFLGVLSNGLNLIGINFYWQAVARGVLILLALVLGALNRRRQN